MTERDRGDDDASDWLSRQFEAGDESDDEPDEGVHDGGSGRQDVPPPRRASAESFTGGPGVPAAPPAASGAVPPREPGGSVPPAASGAVPPREPGGSVPPAASGAVPPESGGSVASAAAAPATPPAADGFVWGLRPRGAAAAASPEAGDAPKAGDAPATGSAADADDATQAMAAPGFDPRAAATNPSVIADPPVIADPSVIADPDATQAMPVAGFDERAAATPVSIEPALDGRPGAEPVGGAFAGLVGGVSPTVADPAPAAPLDADGAAASRRRADGRGGWHPTPAQKRLLWAAGALLAVIALIGLYLLGTRLRPAPEPTPTPSVTPSATPTPTPTPTVEPPVAVGPLPPGVHEWDALQGGECLAPFASAWDEEFTVVDCATPHPAQLVDRGTFPSEPDAAYPGADALQSQINLLCTPPSVIDFAAAAQYPDVVVQGAYPVTAEEWDEGYRDYFCFVTRSSGEPFAGSIAVPQG
ncbi:hypothetical protein CLV46_3137 [Diaminobutyricimonas aerilata]|uniref:Uncharacterized protein n=1 Tax=Diaminobutyricimonas aerilata TaxID=1162967 RepID=A0A2M9CNU6_9MICO|nr:septum formation family protein [Diaminobutyricimonas aerilata]PJJ73544.1 hypothetical protein CLV46_3137 [Diaminobutyricimonas aerilata]